MMFNFNAAEVFDIAIKIEENGKQFYDRSREIIKDPEVQKLFAELAQEEIKHKEKFTSPQEPASCERCFRCASLTLTMSSISISR